jgi:hypothetical protein
MTIPPNDVLIVVVKPLRQFVGTESHVLYLVLCAIRYRSKHLILPECRYGGTSPLASDCGGATIYIFTILTSLHFHSHDMVKIDHSLLHNLNAAYHQSATFVTYCNMAFIKRCAWCLGAIFLEFALS